VPFLVKFIAKRPAISSGRRRRAFRLVSTLPLLTLLTATAFLPHGWDPRPLRSTTPIPRDGLPPEQKAFQAWVSQNGPRLTPEQRQRVHERLYAYISARAKQLDGRFPEKGDTAAFELFRFGASMGAVGADRVARALYPDPAKLPSPASISGFDLSLRPPLFQLASDDGSWAVCYPYYFMTAPSGRQRLSSGILTEVAVLSTLFAADSGPAGSSQATVLLAAAPVMDSTRHISAWVTQLGVRPTAVPPEGGPGAWYASSSSDQMRRLVVVRRLPHRVLVIAYLGLPGTFETNRPHFFNLLSTLAPQHCTASP
jgi:hypothetical protein